MAMAKFIAVAGKGGVGKTTFTGLILRELSNRDKASVLAVDADPNANLNEVLGVEVTATISDILEDTKNPKAIPDGMPKDIFIQYRLQQSLVESHAFDLLVMGGPQGPGCYCYANDLLRKYLENLTDNYDYVVVDTEAGLEHISRRTIPRIDTMFILSDASVRGVRSAGRIQELIDSLRIPIANIHFVITKTLPDSLETLKEEIDRTQLSLIGDIPLDELVAQYDLSGKALFNLPEKSVAVRAVKDILQRAAI